MTKMTKCILSVVPCYCFRFSLIATHHHCLLILLIFLMLFSRLSALLCVNTTNLLSKRILQNTQTMAADMNNVGKQCLHRQINYLTQKQAADLDQELFNEYKFSVDQLMELAGLSVATAVAKVYPPSTHQTAIVICGPGNNGGDGLVAARHMVLFGYTVALYYPKRTPKPLYENLLEQCRRFGVHIEETLPSTTEMKNNYKLIVDALFGFSFKPPVRDELKPALDAMIYAEIPVCCVDIPSGWNVENGPEKGRAVTPSLLISLSAPKLCSRPEYLGDTKHFLGGRFLLPEIIAKYNLLLPPYPDQEQVVQLSC